MSDNPERENTVVVLPSSTKPKLLDHVRAAVRAIHYSPKASWLS